MRAQKDASLRQTASFEPSNMVIDCGSPEEEKKEEKKQNNDGEQPNNS
jgi:hypothetical protein